MEGAEGAALVRYQHGGGSTRTLGKAGLGLMGKAGRAPGGYWEGLAEMLGVTGKGWGQPGLGQAPGFRSAAP